MNERLKIFIEHLKEHRIVHNFADFATQMGKGRSIISEMINGKRTISELFVQEIANKYPELNKEWLLFGVGNMLNGSQPENPVEEKPSLVAEHIPQLSNAEILLRDMLAEERARNEALNEIIWELKEENGRLKGELVSAHKGGDARNVDSSLSASVG